MGHHSVILIFGMLSAFLGYACVSGAKKRIKQIGYHKKHFPQDYIQPSIKMRKVFGLEKKVIPKGLYIEILMVVPVSILFVISSIVYLVSEEKLVVMQFFWWLYIVFGVGYLIFDIVFLIRYR